MPPPSPLLPNPSPPPPPTPTPAEPPPLSPAGGTAETGDVTEGLTSDTGGVKWLWILIAAGALLCCCCCCFLLLLACRRRRRSEKDKELSVRQVTLAVNPVEAPISPYGVPASPRSSFSVSGLGSRVLELRRELSGALPVEEQAVSTPLMEDTIEMVVPQHMLDLPDMASPTSPASQARAPARSPLANAPAPSCVMSRATSGHDMRI